MTSIFVDQVFLLLTAMVFVVALVRIRNLEQFQPLAAMAKAYRCNGGRSDGQPIADWASVYVQWEENTYSLALRQYVQSADSLFLIVRPPFRGVLSDLKIPIAELVYQGEALAFGIFPVHKFRLRAVEGIALLLPQRIDMTKLRQD